MIISKEICDGLSDREIIRKSLKEVDFFSCLYERYEARLLRYIRNLTQLPEEEVEDILQESFIKVWKNLRSFDQSLKLSSWIYRIVHNHAISHLRKEASHQADKKSSWNDILLADIPDSDPEHWEEAREQKEEIRKVLNLLPIHYKEVLVLRYLENMSYEEISDVLKIPEGTVATRINRAKQFFARESAHQHITFY